MAGDYKLPLAITERVRFYDGQFLQDQDFIDEQKYHLARHHRHHRTLHVTGVAEGLTAYVPANSTFQVKVRPGLAIDPDGRQILLTEISSPIDLPADAAGNDRWLYIAYHQVPDKLQSSGQGVEGETRWREAPYIFTSDNPNLGIDDDYEGPDWSSYLSDADGPPPPVRLAKLTIDDQGKVSIDNDARHFAGVRLPGPETMAPTLRTDPAGNVGLWLVEDSDLTERLTISPEGNVGIGANAPTAPLEIGYTLQATRNGQTLVAAKIAPTFDANGKTSIKNYGLLVESGNVGIGTATPATNLEVRGVARAGTSADNYTEISHSGSHGYINTVGVGRLDFQHHGTNQMVLTDASQLGVGLDTPAAQVDITGNGNKTGTISLQLRSGNTNTNFASTQMAFGYNNRAEYRHVIKTRHHANGQAGNAIDFFVWKYLSANNKDDKTAIGTLHTMTLDGGNVGIGTTTPERKLDVAGETRILAGSKDVVFSQGNFGNSNTTDLFFNKGDVGFNQSEFVLFNQNDNVEGERYFQLQYPADAGGLTIRKGGNVGVGITLPGAKLEVNGSLKTASNVSGERELYTESPTAGDHRGDDNTQNATGLVYRVKDNPGSGDPILQVRSSGEAVRFFVEHDGWTGSKDNSAWFGGSRDNYFAGNIKFGGGDWQLDTGSWQDANIRYHGSENSATFGFHGQSSKKVNVVIDGNITANNIAQTEEQLRMIRGTVKADGSKLEGSGFTVTRDRTGVYDVTFSTAFTDRPTVVVSQQFPDDNHTSGGKISDTGGNTRDNALVVGVTNSMVRIKTGDGDGDASNRRFHFIAIGPR